MSSNKPELHLTNTKTKYLNSKLIKTIKYIKKIKALLSSQGLTGIETFKETQDFLHQASKCYLESSEDFLIFHGCPVNILAQNSDKFTSSLLVSFYLKHEELRQKLYENESQYQMQIEALGKETFIKLEEDFPSFQQQRGISKQIKIQSDVFISSQNTFQAGPQKNQKTMSQKILIEKLQRKKRQLERYLKMKLQKKNQETERKQHQQEQQCNRKYGPKVQSQKYNHQEIDEVQKLRQKLLGKQKVNKKQNTKKSRVVKLRKTISEMESPIFPLAAYQSAH